MAKPKFFRDPIHLQIRFDPVNLREPPQRNLSALSWGALQIIDTPELQRLRHIRQNGLGNLVFYGAEHSRFNHSIGVHFVARTMFERVCRNCGENEDFRWKVASGLAALVHDVGHGPFSHTLEEVLKELDVKFDHEDMTARYVRENNTAIHNILAKIDGSLPDFVATFFDKKSRAADSWVYKVVSSQLDGDRLDYVQRDSLFAGLRGHGFDFERLLDLLSHHANSIAVDRGAIEAVEAYLVSIDQAYRAIYYHHAVRAATCMLVSLIRRACELHRNGDKEIFPDIPLVGKHPIACLLEKGTELDLNVYGRLSEFHVWALIDAWQNHNDKVMQYLSHSLLRRQLLKGIEVDQAQFKKRENLVEKACKLVRQSYPDFDGAERFLVLPDDPERVSYKGYDFNPESHDESIWLVGRGKKPVPLENDSDSHIVKSFKARRVFSRLFVPADVREELMKN